MKKKTRIELHWDSTDHLWDCYLTTETGLLLIASVDPRDFPGDYVENIDKARDLAYREGLDVLRKIFDGGG
jgi:hypothetical protein